MPDLDLTDAELREGLNACLAVPRWVDDVVAQAPYATLADLLTAAHAAATPLSAEEIGQALADHPRIGERHAGAGTSATLSAAEQAGSASDDGRLAGALAAGNAAYEERFGRVFLIRAAGRSRAEILAELHRRIDLDDATELAVVGTELRDIASRRIPQLFGPTFPDTDHQEFDDSEAAR